MFPVWFNASDWFASMFSSECVARSCSSCDSTIVLSRPVKKNQGRIVACVFRNLGKMEHLMDLQWLAHRETKHAPPTSLR